MNNAVCSFCKSRIGVKHKNEFYKLNFKVYCSLTCYMVMDKNSKKSASRRKK